MAHRYQTDPDSPFHKVRFRSRTNYGTFINRILADRGDAKIADLNADDVKQLYAEWTKDGHFAMARGLLVMFRMLIKYGALELKDQESGRFYLELRGLEFSKHQSQESGNDQLTPEQITAIIKTGHEMKTPSNALSQAFYSDGNELEQKDILGEWVPKNEPGESDVTSEKDKWIRGIRWEEIDADFVLRHETSREGKIIQINLRGTAPRVMAEIDRMGPRIHGLQRGPVIVSEVTKRPYAYNSFRDYWRKVAEATGLPKEVRIMGTR